MLGDARLVDVALGLLTAYLGVPMIYHGDEIGLAAMGPEIELTLFPTEISTLMNTPLLRTDKLCRQVDGKFIVNAIDLEVYPGDLVAVIGRSGAGKSSFLRLLNRLDEPTSGAVYLHDQDYRQLAPRRLRRQVGMMMQAAHLFPGTVADNLRFGPRQQDIDLTAAVIESLLAQVGLPAFANRDILHLSGGEAQRVSLARTLANQPEMLLLDEPTSALDERAEREIEELLLQIFQAQQLTGLMVTHDTAQALRLANRAILLHEGKLLYTGSVQEVLDAQSTLC
ncbi:MAG: ATP-binding cassette domain-containing protein [Caldilineaceae bacterium]|nr:ATP-binding cassette domain-containing protein [Caldilineaceae bacterium]